MLESFRKGQRWLTLLFVATIGLVFVFFLGVGGSMGPTTPTGNAVVELDDMQLTLRDFNRERRNTEARLREQLGDAYDEVGADRYVDSQTLSQIINTVVLAAAARELGLHVTTDEVRRVVQSSPAFIDAEGKFSPAAFNVFAEREYGTQRAFIRSFTRSLLGQKLVEVLVAQTTVSDAELDLLTRYALDEVRIAYVAIDGTRLPTDESLSDEDVEVWAEAHEAELRETFNDRAESLAAPEQIRARHILIRMTSDATDEEVAKARSQAEAARSRVERGEDFVVVAGEVSEDVGTASNGGDLGRFSRGDNDPALDEAAFALETGGLSEVVRSDHGFHVIRVDERYEARSATWDGFRLELAREGATAERARTLADLRAQALADRIDEGGSLEDAARLAGVDIGRPPGLRRRPDGFVPGLGAAPHVLSAAFALAEGASSSEIFDVAERRVLFQVLERSLTDEATVEAERDARRAQTLAQKQNQIVDAWLTDSRRQLETDGRLRINATLALGSS